MTGLRLKRALAMLAVGIVIFPVRASGADEERVVAASTDEEEVAALIRNLGDPSYRIRTDATRRLCTIGMPAHEMVRKAADSDDSEVALRAKTLLAVFDRILFAGVEITLEFPETKITWDEPVTLYVTMVNRSNHAARLPFEISSATRAMKSPDALHVGDMLDIADWLRVLRTADEHEIELRVDDIAADSAVVAAVQERLNGGPISVLKPGQRVTMTATAFNRGWARYALLDRGVYKIVFDYVPDWNDEILRSQRVGRAVSNEVTITVTKSAPPAISRGGVEASIELERNGSFLVARMTNRTDQSLLVNLNFGGFPPFAEGRWVCTLDEATVEMPVAGRMPASWHDFDGKLLVEVAPGRPVELARIHKDDLQRGLVEAGVDLTQDRWTVHFSYGNRCDRQWQVARGPALIGNSKAPEVFRKLLPRRILSARHSSNRLTVTGAD